TLFKVLELAGNSVQDDVTASVIYLVGESTDQHGYSVRRLCRLLENSTEHQPLVQVAMYCLGEFGTPAMLDGSIGVLSGETDLGPISEETVLRLYQQVLQAGQRNALVTREYALSSAMKYCTRCQSVTVLTQLKELVSSFATNISVELQQRGLEFTQLFGPYEHLRNGLLERIPPLENRQAIREKNKASSANSSVLQKTVESEEVKSEPQETSGSAALLDLLSLDMEPALPAAPAPLSSENKENLLDILLNFGGGGEAPLATNILEAPTTTTSNSIFDGFGDLSSLNSVVEKPRAPSVSFYEKHGLKLDVVEKPRAPSVSFYEKHGLKLEFEFSSAEIDVVGIPTAVMTLTATNSGAVPVSNFLFQAAVPKTFQLQLSPPSGTTVGGSGGRVTQTVKVRSLAAVPPALRMRVKLSFSIGSVDQADQCEINQFPALCWSN
ncbi:unnamed protein product, partial [Notodromas monacha]